MYVEVVIPEIACDRCRAYNLFNLFGKKCIIVETFSIVNIYNFHCGHKSNCIVREAKCSPVRK